MLSFEPNNIREIRISKDKKTILISRKDLSVTDDEQKDVENKPSETKKGDVIWQTAEGDQLDTSDLKRLLSSLSQLDCEKYIKGGKKDDFKAPDLFIKLNGEAKEYSISVFSKTNKDATNYPAISSENKHPFFLSNSQVDNLKTNMEKIIKTDN